LDFKSLPREFDSIAIVMERSALETSTRELPRSGLAEILFFGEYNIDCNIRLQRRLDWVLDFKSLLREFDKIAIVMVRSALQTSTHE